MRTIVLSVILAALPVSGYAAGGQIDSLFKAWEDAGFVKSVPAANAFMEGLYQEGWTDTLTVYPTTANRASVAPDIYYWMADWCTGAGRYSEAAGYGQQSLDLFRKQRVRSDDNIADVLSLLSVIYQHLGDYSSALYYQEQCYDIDLAGGDKAKIRSSLHNLACIYYFAGDYETAFGMSEKAIAMAREVGNRKALAVSLGFGADNLNKLGYHERALEYATEACALDREDGREDKTGVRLSQMAESEIALGQLSDAEKHLAEAAFIFDGNGNLNSRSIVHSQMARIMVLKGKERQAKNHERL